MTADGPIEKLADNLWRVQAPMAGKPDQMRGMSLARLDDWRVVIHNAIALDDSEMAAVDQWGDVAAILVPIGYHRQDAWIMKERYPKVYAPTGAVKRVKAALPVDGTFSDAPGDARSQGRTGGERRWRGRPELPDSGIGVGIDLDLDMAIGIGMRSGGGMVTLGLSADQSRRHR